MNTTNPFQVPTCLQRAHSQQRRQSRIKAVVFSSVAVTTTLLIFLLVEGCMSEHAKSAVAAQNFAALTPETAPASQSSSVPAQPIITPQTKPVTPPAVVSASPLRGATSRVLNSPATCYVVKSGDTLAHIAKQYRLPVKTIMAFNNLEDDRLVVGTKLKLPAA
ncbi:MAG TPA: LysM peptidoglycan-binding domain-containing protein [Verrucomicrobiae bacterium]|nr:LysM peptidoglycan-binding domain-containing protein [Verrucomicrobiae bacterium]